MRLFTLILCLSLVLQPYAYAEPVFIRAPESNVASFDAFIKLNRSGTSLSQYAEQQSPSKSDRKTLLETFEKAQEEYLNGTLATAVEYYKKVVGAGLSSDWAIDERNAIHFSYMRLAQLSGAEAERDKWLGEAVQFDPEQKPEANLFPPPLIKEFWNRHNIEKLNASRWNISHLRNKVKFLKLNGRKFDLQKGEEIVVHNGKHRISFFSDTWLGLSRTMNKQQILAIEIPKIEAIGGSCANPTLKDLPDFIKSQAVLFYDSECLISLKPNNEAEKSNATTWVNSANSKQKPMVGALSKKEPEYQPLPEVKSSNTTLWVVLGLIGVGIGTALALSQKSGPSETETSANHK